MIQKFYNTIGYRNIVVLHCSVDDRFVQPGYAEELLWSGQWNLH